MKLRLFRGLALAPKDEDRVISEIKSNGISIWPKSNYQIEIVDNKNKIDLFYNQTGLTSEQTRPSKWIENKKGGGHAETIGGEKTICFADRTGAEYYAKKHNATKEKFLPILIEIEEDIENVFIDGRDFLASCMGMADTNSDEKFTRQKNALVRMFGQGVARYMDKIKAVTKADRIAYYDLAMQDASVIEGHYNNKTLIGGRFGTVFRSAFFVKTPILAKKVVSVTRLDIKDFLEMPSYTLDQFLEK